MGKKLEKRRQRRIRLVSFQAEEGYLMLSTLFLLVLTGIFLQSAINISANYIIQLNQLSMAYQAKTALNMSERILHDYITEHSNELPEQGELSSSVGNIKMTKKTKNCYDAVLTQKNGVQTKKRIYLDRIDADENEEKELDEESDILPDDSLELPIEENNHAD